MRRFALLELGLVPAAGASDAAQPAVWNVVALGDSDATGEGDATGLGWVGRYARLLRQELGLRVVVTNLAVGGKTSGELLSELRSDAATRAAVRKAQVVLVGNGGADLGAGDERLDAGTCKGAACYAADLQAFGGNLDAAAAVVRKLRGADQAVLRAITLPNVVPGARDVVPAFITETISVYQTRNLKRFICLPDLRNAKRPRCLPGVQRSRRNPQRVRQRMADQESMLLPQREGSAGHGWAGLRVRSCAAPLATPPERGRRPVVRGTT